MRERTRMWCTGALAVWTLTGWAGTNGVGAAGGVRIVSSSHQDTAWMDTPAFCRRFRVEQNILPALEMMGKDPDYCFAMECALHLMEFLEAHPERRDEVIRRMREGRLEFGATYNQPYESYLSGEELVRQTYYGRRWIRANLPGCDARVAYNPDVPGRALQMQQILAKAGIPYLFISRYHEGLYRWKSPDGSSVLAYTPGHYGNHMHALELPADKAVGAVGSLLKQQVAYYRQRDIPPLYALVNSMDFSKPKDFRPLIDAWNGQAAAAGLPTMAYGTMVDFFKGIDDPRARFDTRMGERPDVWLYIHGPTHHETTSARREAARLLPAAEAFNTFACLLDGSFANYPAKALDEAWMDELYIDHGIGGKNGHITDEVFHRKVLSARDTGRALLDRALADIAARVKPSSISSESRIPVTVFNTLPWTRSAPVEWTLPDAKEAGETPVTDMQGRRSAVRLPLWDAARVSITDASGKEVACQPNRQERIRSVNFALASQGAKATASSSYDSHYGPEKAIDGKWLVRDPNPETGDAEKWNTAAGAKGPHWLEIDFGQPRRIDRIVIRHEGVIGAFGHEVKDNTAAYALACRLAPDGSWEDVIPTVTNNTAALTVHGLSHSIEMRCLRLTVTQGTQTDNSYARIYEVEAYGAEKEAPPAVVFLAEEVPGFGFKTYYARPLSSGPRPGYEPSSPVRGIDTLENDFYRVKLAPGGLASVFDKEQKRELLATGGNGLLGGEPFTMLSVAADNRGKGTDAGEFGAAPQPVMDASFARVQGDASVTWCAPQEEACTLYTAARSDFVLRGTRVRQTVTLWKKLKQIDVAITLNDYNGELWREFRAAFPLALDQAQITYGAPMGVVRVGKDEVPTTGGFSYGKLDYYERCADIRPREVLDFIDARDARGGVTLTADVSVFDWRDATGLCPAGATVLQPVLLATRKSCNGEGNWYPQAGTHTFRFSLTSHGGAWQDGWRAGVAANHPLVAVTTRPRSDASLPAEYAFLKVEASNVWVTAVKKAEDNEGVVARLVEMEGRDGRAEVGLFQPIRAARRVSLIEDDQSAADLHNGSVAIPLGHHAIETVRLQF